MSDKQKEVCKVIQDRIEDAHASLRECPMNHPMEAQHAFYLKSLNDLKRDLQRCKLWVE